MDKLIKCLECGKWYYFFPFHAKNQAMCPTCMNLATAEANAHYQSHTDKS